MASQFSPSIISPYLTAKQENHQTQGVSPYVPKNAQNNSNHITGHSNRILNQNFFFKKIYLAGPGLCCGVRTLSYGMWDLVLQPGMEPGSMHWELGGLATGPPPREVPGFLDRVHYFSNSVVFPSQYSTADGPHCKVISMTVEQTERKKSRK